VLLCFLKPGPGCTRTRAAWKRTNRTDQRLEISSIQDRAPAHRVRQGREAQRPWALGLRAIKEQTEELCCTLPFACTEAMAFLEQHKEHIFSEERPDADALAINGFACSGDWKSTTKERGALECGQIQAERPIHIHGLSAPERKFIGAAAAKLKSRHQIESPIRPPKESAQGRLAVNSEIPDFQTSASVYLYLSDSLSRALTGSWAPHPLRSRNSRHLQCCPFWCPRGIPAGRHYPRGTGGGAGDGLPDVHEIALTRTTRVWLQTAGHELL
jgi:hypothetical protein